MEKLTQEQIVSILDLHDKWLKDISSGIKADFSDKDLMGANLEGASLMGGNLENANLRGASLMDANLRDANLENASLMGANLMDANLRDASLRGASLMGADLRSADLRSASLENANLMGANLMGASLMDANLRGADLRSASLRDASLMGANLDNIKKDFLAKLLLAKNEILGLYDYLMKGKINGSCYEGECACFCGTIANICGQYYKNLTSGLKPDSNSPTEKWFLAIRKGDIPQNNQVSDITAQWMREFMDKENIQYPKYEIVAI